MDEKDIKTIEPGDDDLGDDEEDAELLRSLIAKVKSDEEPAEKKDEPPAKEEPKKEPVKDDEPVETKVEPVTEPDKAPDKSAVDIEAEVAKRAQEMFESQRQRLVDEIIRKERNRDESAKKQLKEIELAFGAPFEQLLAKGRQGRIDALVNDGYDEGTAKRIVQTEEENARMKAVEAQRQAEHATFQARAKYQDERNAFLSDSTTDPSVKRIAQKYQSDIDAFALDAIADGREMAYDVARDYVIGRHLSELMKEQQAEVERIKTATEQRVLADVQKRGKATPESASPSGLEEKPTLSRPEKAFVNKLATAAGLSEADVNDIAAKRKKK